MVQLTITLEGADTLAAGVNRAASRTLPHEAQRALTDSLRLIEADARRGVKRDTGRLQRSIRSTVEQRGTSLIGRVGPSVSYGLFVERGRRPGRPPPVSALAGWARRHGVSPAGVYAVARAIGRRGIPAAPFLVPAFEKNRARILERFRQVGLRVVREMAATGRRG